MFDASTAIRTLGYPVRFRKAEDIATRAETAETNDQPVARAKRPTSPAWSSPEWWVHHNYQFQTYRDIFRGR